MNKTHFVEAVLDIAAQQEYPVADSRSGRQIDFGNKKIHEKHLKTYYLEILEKDSDHSNLIINI